MVRVDTEKDLRLFRCRRGTQGRGGRDGGSEESEECGDGAKN